MPVRVLKVKGPKENEKKVLCHVPMLILKQLNVRLLCKYTLMIWVSRCLYTYFEKEGKSVSSFSKGSSKLSWLL